MMVASSTAHSIHRAARFALRKATQGYSGPTHFKNKKREKRYNILFRVYGGDGICGASAALHFWWMATIQLGLGTFQEHR